MRSVFLAQWMKEKRSPYLVLIFCALSIVATLLFGSNIDAKIKVDAFLGEGVMIEEAERWLERLNSSGAFVFKLRDEEKALDEVWQGRSSMAVRLLKDDYRIIAAMENMNISLVQQHMQSVYMDELRMNAVVKQVKDEELFRKELSDYLVHPPLTLQSAAASGGELKSYDMGLQLLFTFTLFLAMLTVGFKVNAMTAEKVSGIWNRVILSPVTKTQMYLGHLSYSTLIGIIQMTLVFFIFKYVFGYDLGDQSGLLAIIIVLYITTIVAMCMLLTGLLRKPEQFTGILTSFVPIMPLISGAYMPPGTIKNEVLQVIAQFIPLKHALDAFVGVAIYQHGLEDIYLPLAKLILMCVIFFGVGINLVERRSK